MFGILNDFIYGALWLGLTIAFGVTGWRAVHSGYFQAVSERYYGRKAQGLGGALLLVAIVAGVLFLRTLLSDLAFGLGGSALFFLLGAVLGAFFAVRYYLRAA
ncbi:MAG TPA: hypothetical protein VFS62_01970 [Chloroflexota bacterium]|jgi:hypothetical protein|nr:hypothetical protein [Chloroflexota bacterium]